MTCTLKVFCTASPQRCLSFASRVSAIVNTASTAGHKTVPNQAVYSGTKFAARAISEGLRQEAGDKLRVTIISPGFVRTNFADSVTNPELKAQLADSRDKFAIPPDAIARAICVRDRAAG